MMEILKIIIAFFRSSLNEDDLLDKFELKSENLRFEMPGRLCNRLRLYAALAAIGALCFSNVASQQRNRTFKTTLHLQLFILTVFVYL
jgi:hypothetical protein